MQCCRWPVGGSLPCPGCVQAQRFIDVLRRGMHPDCADAYHISCLIPPEHQHPSARPLKFGDDTSWSLMEVISSLKTSLRLAKDRQQTLEDELLMSRVANHAAPRSTTSSVPDHQQRHCDGRKTPRMDVDACETCEGGSATRQETRTKPSSIDKSATLSANCCRTGVAPASQLMRHLATPSCPVHGDIRDTCTRAGSRRDSGKQDESTTNGNCCSSIKPEADCGPADGGRTGDRTPVLNRFGSSVRSRDVTASSDKRAEVVRDRGSEDPTSPSPTTATTQTSPTLPQSRPRIDVILQRYRRSVDHTTRPTVTDTSHPVSDDEKSQNSPGSVAAATDKTASLSTGSITARERSAAAFSSANGERLRHDYARSPSMEPDTAEAGSTLLTGRKRIPAENKVDQATLHNVHPSITTAAKSPNKHATYVPQYVYATKRVNTEITETQPNVLFSSFAGANGTLPESVPVERNFGGRIIATQENVRLRDGAVSAADNSASDGGRAASNRKWFFDEHSSTSASTERADARPKIAGVVETPSFNGAKKMSTNTRDSAPRKDTDDARGTRANEAATTSSTSSVRTTDLAGVKRSDESAVRGSEIGTQPDKAANWRAAEQAAAVSRSDRLNRNAPSGFDDAASSAGETVDVVKSGGAVAAPDRSPVDPVAVKLVRVDRALRSVPPVAPESIRRAGVATPAVQARHLANTTDTAVTSPRAAPRSIPTADTRQTGNNVQQSSP